MQVFSVTINKRVYTFGNLALRRFTEALGCGPTIQAVYAAFQGATQIGAGIEMIKGGVEQASGEMLNDRDAGAIMDKLTDDQQAKLITTFLSSLVGEDFEAYLKKIEAELKAADDNDEAEAGQTINAEGEKNEKNDGASPTGGAKSKKKPSEKSD